MLDRFRVKARALFRKSQVEEDLEEELLYHLSKEFRFSRCIMSESGRSSHFQATCMALKTCPSHLGAADY
jgi:hypothetical protein